MILFVFPTPASSTASFHGTSFFVGEDAPEALLGWTVFADDVINKDSGQEAGEGVGIDIVDTYGKGQCAELEDNDNAPGIGPLAVLAERSSEPPPFGGWCLSWTQVYALDATSGTGTGCKIELGVDDLETEAGGVLAVKAKGTGYKLGDTIDVLEGEDPPSPNPDEDPPPAYRTATFFAGPDANGDPTPLYPCGPDPVPPTEGEFTGALGAVGNNTSLKVTALRLELVVPYSWTPVVVPTLGGIGDYDATGLAFQMGLTDPADTTVTLTTAKAPGFPFVDGEIPKQPERAATLFRPQLGVPSCNKNASGNINKRTLERQIQPADNALRVSAGGSALTMTDENGDYLCTVGDPANIVGALVLYNTVAWGPVEGFRYGPGVGALGPYREDGVAGEGLQLAEMMIDGSTQDVFLLCGVTRASRAVAPAYDQTWPGQEGLAQLVTDGQCLAAGGEGNSVGAGGSITWADVVVPVVEINVIQALKVPLSFVYGGAEYELLTVSFASGIAQLTGPDATVTFVWDESSRGFPPARDGNVSIARSLLLEEKYTVQLGSQELFFTGGLDFQELWFDDPVQKVEEFYNRYRVPLPLASGGILIPLPGEGEPGDVEEIPVPVDWPEDDGGVATCSNSMASIWTGLYTAASCQRERATAATVCPYSGGLLPAECDGEVCPADASWGESTYCDFLRWVRTVRLGERYGGYKAAVSNMFEFGNQTLLGGTQEQWSTPGGPSATLLLGLYENDEGRWGIVPLSDDAAGELTALTWDDALVKADGDPGTNPVGDKYGPNNQQAPLNAVDYEYLVLATPRVNPNLTGEALGALGRPLLVPEPVP